MSKKALAVGGGILALLGFGFLISRVKAKAATVPVTVMANPIRTVLLIDGQEVETPAKLNLQPGTHSFTAIPKNPDLVVLYGFDRWTLNGQVVSYSSNTKLFIDRPSTVKAEYTIEESGRYPLTAFS